MTTYRVISNDNKYFNVEIIPSKLKRFFGVKSEFVLVRDTGRKYELTGTSQYILSDGTEITWRHPLSLVLEKYKRSLIFNQK